MTTEARKKPRMQLATQVILGLVSGLVTGIFFGELVAFLKVFGNAFIMLLQMTVIPYITVSLITALGRLTYADVRSLGLKAGGVLLVLWGVGLAVVLLAPLTFPKWPSASFFSTSQVETVPPVDFLQLYIPANPFHSLANTIVPAIVVFSVLLGLALISVKDKEALLAPLSAAGDALLGVTGFVGKLAPYGVFALTASAAGTIDVDELRRLQVYIVTYVSIAIIVSFWLLPGLVAAVTPLRYGEVVRGLRGPLVAAFATGSLLIVLPVLANDSKKLIARAAGHADESDEGAAASIDVLIPAAYNFPNLGSILSLLFVLFAGWYIGSSVPATEYPALSVTGLATLFGGTLLAIPFLLDLLHLPADLFEVFVTVDVLGIRVAAVVAAMHVVTVALIGAYAVQGKVRLRAAAVVRFSGITIALLVGVLLGVRAFYTYVVVAPYTKADVLADLNLLEHQVPLDKVKVYLKPPETVERSGEGPASVARIMERGVLRVCYKSDDYPSAFLNLNGDLVGFDIEMAHALANHLVLGLEFLSIDTEGEALKGLNARYCDIYMSHIAISPFRTQLFAMTSPVFNSSIGLIVEDYRREEFRTWANIQNLGAIRVGIPDSETARRYAEDVMPSATLVPIRTTADLESILQDGGADFDAIGASSEEGAAWTILYPDFSLVVPQPPAFIRVGYAVAHDNVDLLHFVDTWLLSAKARGTVDALYDYWMLGRTKTARSPRWSVIRDLLHWVD